MNRKEYYESLEKNIKDKMFWLDKINLARYDIIVDYGCGSGFMEKEIRKINNDILYIGFDKYFKDYDSVIINKDGKNLSYLRCSYDQLDLYLNALKNKDSSLKILFIFSSSLHEICSQDYLDWLFCKTIIEKYADTIVIRDMYYEYIAELTDNKFLILEKIKKDLELSKLFNDYVEESKHSTSLMEFLLKYHYKNNYWRQELKEDYFSTRWYWFLNLPNKKIVYDYCYSIPYLEDKIKKDLNLPDDWKMPNTHRNLILERKR